MWPEAVWRRRLRGGRLAITEIFDGLLIAEPQGNWGQDSLPLAPPTDRSAVDALPVVDRISVRGKFLYAGSRKFWVRGVTYGTFAETADGANLPSPSVVAADFQRMAAAGINSVRVYAVPPRWLLDQATKCGLYVMIGLPWEQHVAFLANPRIPKLIMERLRQQLQPIAGHPAILCYPVGNEIPASVVRWHGRKKVEGFLRSLANLIRALDAHALITYVNFPTTEYLDLSFVDFYSFNVYLEDRDSLRKYLARLQNIAGDKPLVMAELGLDSRRNGTEKQAVVLDWQVRTAFEAGCAGCFVFAWTDEWHRGGLEILDWDFGLTSRDRSSKPALQSVSKAFADVPLADREWPLISVVVCSYNGAATIEETLRALMEVDYERKQVIVVNDGSTDATAEIASRYDVELISTQNRGLSNARNSGMDAARGDIIAYIDDDAYPDPDWLKYLGLAFMENDFAAVGGPNIAPPEDGDICECIANAPGGPIHVLLDDQIAEHIPGCNMAFRLEKLRAIGGFDPQFRVAGDDVDTCWRLMDSGEVVGFHAAAMVWHHRRPSISRYLKQQRGYARAEALLAGKWPDKYNWAGHLSWHGRLYGRGLIELPLKRRRIYHGTWNSAPFQSIYAQAEGLFTSLPLMPEWYFIVAVLGAMALLGIAWTPLLAVAPLALAGLALSAALAIRAALKAHIRSSSKPRMPAWRMRLIVAWLHLVQPAARLLGRIQHGIGPWKRTSFRLAPVPLPDEKTVWREEWRSLESRLSEIQMAMQDLRIPQRAGGVLDNYDFALRQSLLGEVRVTSMVEEHGSGRQLIRFRSRPVVFGGTFLAIGLVTGLSVLAFLDRATAVGSILGALALMLAWACYTGLCRAGHDWGRVLAASFGASGSQRLAANARRSSGPDKRPCPEGSQTQL